MIIKIIMYIKVYLLIHYNFEELILDKLNFTITPYYYIKNKSLSISFYVLNYEKNITNLLEINCENNIKIIKINKNIFVLNSFIYKFNCDKCFLNINFDNNNLIFNFNNDFSNNLKFKCNWKFLKLKFLVENYIDLIKITNIQITNDIKTSQEYLNPLIFVDLKQEPLNSLNFKNKFGLYHGGINGTENNISSKLWSEYNKELNGVDWIINNNYQFIKLDNNSFYNIAKKLNNIYSVYINFDIIYKFLIKDINKIKTRKMPIFSVFSNNLKSYVFIVTLNIIIKNYKLWLVFSEDKNFSGIKFISVNLKNKDNLEQIIKNGIGLKYLIISYISKNLFKMRLGFKNNSIFYKNSLEPKLFKNYIYNNHIGPKNYNYFIGNYHNYLKKKNYFDKYLLCYLIINEYAIFSGIYFDKIEKTDSDINLIWDGNNKLIINNNYNLNRKYNLKSKNKALNCLTINCILCSNNEICLYCKNGYYLDKMNNCNYNFNKNYFINEYSELIKTNIIFNDNMFKIFKNSVIINPEILKIINNGNNIFLNIKYLGGLNRFNKLNISLNGQNNTILLKKNNFNLFFNNLFLTNNFLKDNYGIKMNKFIKIYLGYEKINILVYKNIDCNKSKKKCFSYIKDKYYNKVNYLLNCPKNCWKCIYNYINESIICQNCLNGFILINNHCFFNNMFKCYKNKLIDISDYKNDDKIKICDDFCNICNQKNGLICYIKNLNFDFCDKNNIMVYKSINNKNNLKNIINLDLNNNKISKCLKGYYINENETCEKCNNKCIKCVDTLSCNSCKKGYFLKNKQCYSCNIKFKNCNNCSNNKCLVHKFIKKIKIINCKINIGNKCIKCEDNFSLINNLCTCKFKNNFYFNFKLNKCYNCKDCKFCMGDHNNCPTCKKCWSLIKFNIQQNNNEIILFYDNLNIKLNESPILLKIFNIKNYIILFKFKKIIIRIFEKKINKTKLLIKNEIIKKLKYGYFKPQIFNISSYSLNLKKSKKIIKSTKLNIKQKYKFNKFKSINKNFKVSVNYISNFILNSNFLKIFTPIIIILNFSSLIVLWDNNFSTQFLEFIDIFKKKQLFYIDNNIFFIKSEFIKSYEKIKSKYNNNRIIGEIYLLDLDTILLWWMILVYNLIKLIKENNKNIITKFFLKYSLYFKLFYFNIIQNNLIKFVYKIIFFSELFFELNMFFNKWVIFVWVNLNILVIYHFWYTNYLYSCLFLNPRFNYKLKYKDDKIIKLFVQYKRKITRNYNLLMNILDIITVFVLMLLKNYFILSVTMLIIIISIKLFYVININKKQIRFNLVFNIISFIILFNFFTLILIQNYLKLKSDITKVMIIWFLLINILEITKIIVYFIIKYYKKKVKKKHLYLINMYKNIALKNLMKFK